MSNAKTCVYFIISAQFNKFLLVSLTALPVRMAELQVSAGTSWVLLGSLRAADVLNLVVERFESGINLGIVLTKVSRSLVGPHVPERIRGLLSVTQTSKGRHVNARPRGTRRTRGSRISRGTLREKKMERKMQGLYRALHTVYTFLFSLVTASLCIFSFLAQVQLSSARSLATSYLAALKGFFNLMFNELSLLLCLSIKYC